ncbi:hypothetical protein BKA62DRAFT_820326 [Auriculariales sp. MPI-PUGE-AT-0066]|nr:hypothetical protein BKA62DRAFT_820326 [Auriculariales sp. MPI-PUGE-AT-0066]
MTAQRYKLAILPFVPHPSLASPLQSTAPNAPGSPVTGSFAVSYRSCGWCRLIFSDSSSYPLARWYNSKRQIRAQNHASYDRKYPPNHHGEEEAGPNARLAELKTCILLTKTGTGTAMGIVKTKQNQYPSIHRAWVAEGKIEDLAASWQNAGCYTKITGKVPVQMFGFAENVERHLRWQRKVVSNHSYDRRTNGHVLNREQQWSTQSGHTEPLRRIAGQNRRRGVTASTVPNTHQLRRSILTMTLQPVRQRPYAICQRELVSEPAVRAPL